MTYSFIFNIYSVSAPDKSVFNIYTVDSHWLMFLCFYVPVQWRVWFIGDDIIPGPSDVLIEAQVDVLTQEECAVSWPNTPLSRMHICVQDKAGFERGACNVSTTYNHLISLLRPLYLLYLLYSCLTYISLILSLLMPHLYITYIFTYLSLSVYLTILSYMYISYSFHLCITYTFVWV